ncbi:hypothetical protein MHBO_004567 [Bonamia ostreae]|uniref:Casein kinase II subunit beta n=1 Tax=Bonamia ostreae TaxID=126728 RepID=A0ABV2AUF5_9EUKA
MILDTDSSGFEHIPDNTIKSICKDAATLYGLIHARFILTGLGLEAMHEKLNEGEFGKCPRVYCRKALLPVGLYDEFGLESVKMFCIGCNDVYQPPEGMERVDGAYFGTTFAHLFYLAFPELVPKDKKVKLYEPKVFGFRLHSTAHERSIECKKTGRSVW